VDGLDYGPVDVDALTWLIADRLTAVAPGTVMAADGMVRVAGSGIDIAHIVIHAEDCA
jgi:hypothetical protein